MMKRNWSPESWKAKEARQIPSYPDGAALDRALTTLAHASPLTRAADAAKLKAQLGDIAAGRGFLLQGGDCAESFAEFGADHITGTYHLLRDMGAVMMKAADMPVTCVGRMAGQFAKPRSQDLETRGTTALPAYRGDMINGLDFSVQSRTPDPARMVRAYEQAAQTIGILEQCAHDPFYTAHESLMLPYEQALTRVDGDGGWYATSAHFLWIGARTAHPDSAHVEFARGIDNPLGLKCAPEMDDTQLLRLCDILNPANEPGRLTLIVRMGHNEIAARLPRLIRAVTREGRSVVWACDPMHGNTFLSENGYKTRDFNHVRQEVIDFFAIHRAEGTFPGGVHLELTGQDVTECVGGAQNIAEADLSSHYRTHCDPRLNKTQSMEMAERIAQGLSALRTDRNICTQRA